MRARTRQQWQVIARVVLLSIVIGIVYNLFQSGEVVEGAFNGAAISVFLSAFELFVVESPRGAALRRRPLWVTLLVRGAVYGVVILGVLTLGAMVGGHPVLDRFVYSAILSFIATTIIVFGLTLRRLIGGRTFVALMIGRYHRPRSEERLVLFLDIIGSTSVAERLGPERFLLFLDRFFIAATEAILEAGGEIYRYVGDAVIVTWTMAPPARLGRSVAAVFAIEDAISEQRSAWEHDFGVVPRFRAALHAGPLTVGEIGDVKREITMVGDTMNTAARLEATCREVERPFLLSDAALESLTLPPGVRAEGIGPISLRGRSGQITLFAVSRAEAPDAVPSSEDEQRVAAG